MKKNHFFFREIVPSKYVIQRKLRILALAYANHITENCQVGNCRRQAKKWLPRILFRKKLQKLEL